MDKKVKHRTKPKTTAKRKRPVKEQTQKVKLTDRELEVAKLIISKMKDYVDKKIEKVVAEFVINEQQYQQQPQYAPQQQQQYRQPKRQKPKLPDILSKNPILNEVLHETQGGISAPQKAVDRLRSNGALTNKYRQIMSEVESGMGMEDDDYDPYGDRVDVIDPQYGDSEYAQQQQTQYQQQQQYHPSQQQQQVKVPQMQEVNEYNDLFFEEGEMEQPIELNEGAIPMLPTDEVSMNDIMVMTQGKNYSNFSRKYPSQHLMSVNDQQI